MRPADLGASSRRQFIQAGAGLLASALCAACGASASKRPPALLDPVFSITGAPQALRMDVAGNPVQDSISGHVPLVFPVAVAAGFNDLYIADAGTSRLYRYDRTFNAMVVMPETRIGPLTRLQLGPDGSIYILDPFASEIRRYSRGGQSLPTLRPRLATSRYSNFVLDPLTAKAYALDSGHLIIDEIQPMGRIAIEHQRIEEPGPMATDGRSLFVGSSRCGCVIEWIGTRQGRRFGAGKFRQPLAIAVDGHRMYGIDAFDRSLVLLHEEGVDAMAPAQLGMLAPEGLCATGNLLYVADGAGRRVIAFRPGMRRPG